MKAARIPQFGRASVITNGDLPQPEVVAEQLLVRVKAEGVSNWDALIREGKVALQPLPLILGSELSGIVEGIGVQTANDLPSRFWAQENGHLGISNVQFSVWPSSCCCQVVADASEPSRWRSAEKTKILRRNTVWRIK